MDYRESQTILSIPALREFIDQMEYKPGYTIDVFNNPYEGAYLSVRFHAPNANDHDGEEVALRINSPIPNIARFSEQSFYEWLLERLIKIEIHEACEFFRINGVKFYDPHKPIEPDHD